MICNGRRAAASATKSPPGLLASSSSTIRVEVAATCAVSCVTVEDVKDRDTIRRSLLPRRRRQRPELQLRDIEVDDGHAAMIDPRAAAGH